MIEINILLLLSTALVLGVFLGAQIAEAILFVPIWKSMDADDFFQQHDSVGPIIYRFFAPLTIAATVIPLLAVALNLVSGASHIVLFIILGVSTLVFFSTYFVYFKEANQKFADRAISNEDLPAELNRWSNWHWFRIAFETIAFITSLFILLFN